MHHAASINEDDTSRSNLLGRNEHQNVSWHVIAGVEDPDDDDHEDPGSYSRG